jgi:two-component system sensor histidine kinase TctE
MPFRAFATPKQHRQPSLFGEILDWMLAPLMILWPLSMALEYSLAYTVANTAYDRELRNELVVISRQLNYGDGRVTLPIPSAARNILVSDELAETVFQVRGLDNEIVDGDRELAGIEFQPDMEPGRAYFRNETLRQRDMRVAYMFAQVRGMTGAVLVQVAETEEKRSLLASNIIGGVLAAQFVLLPVALVLVWLGLSKGIAPLEEIRSTIRNRKPQDLSPIDPTDAPEEIRPFIDSINDLMRRLDMSLQSQQRFVADAAHQMRTPLAGLKTQAELALRQHDLAGIEQTMRQIAVGADRASRLINQLLALAHAESHAQTPMQRLDLQALVKDVARDWVAQAQNKGIDLGFEPKAHSALVDGNALLLRELLGNLLDNAIRYTPSGGTVTARVAADDALVTVDIEDNGMGIPDRERELVFERFYRVLGTGSEGSGLGLAIVREIAEVHHGRVELLSAARGTLLRVSLPRARATTVPLHRAA